MEIITTNPGFHHIAQDIFKNLDVKDLMACRRVNKSWKNILDNPIFWCSMLTPKNIRKSWETLVKTLMKNNGNYFEFQQKILLLLIKLFHKKNSKHPLELAVEMAEEEKYPELVKIILEHADPNSYIQNEYHGTVTPIFLGSLYGLHGTVEILLNKYESPMAPNNLGETPIHIAATNGHLEIVKLLVAHTDPTSVMTFNQLGYNPIHMAATNGHLNVIKFLVAYTETPNVNAPFQHTLKLTPIQIAFILGHHDVVEFLKEYCQIDNIF